ncbi:hypothetical protein [Tetragenococcus muriaticus]
MAQLLLGYVSIDDLIFHEFVSVDEKTYRVH